MPIVSSVLVEDSAQKDARRWIRERHIDQVGQRYEFAYLCAQAFDAAAAMAARVPGINASLIADEIGRNVAAVTTLGSLAVPTFVYSTAAQNIAALRALYAIATRDDVIFAGDYLSTLTDVQLQNAFSMTAGQVTTLRTNKLTPAATLAASIRNAVGQ